MVSPLSLAIAGFPESSVNKTPFFSLLCANEQVCQAQVFCPRMCKRSLEVAYFCAEPVHRHAYGVECISSLSLKRTNAPGDAAFLVWLDNEACRL